MRTLQSGMKPDDVSWEVNFVCHIAVHVNMSIVQTVESVEWMCSSKSTLIPTSYTSPARPPYIHKKKKQFSQKYVQKK